MALLFMESFDGYGGNASHATQWISVGGLGTSAPTPRTGTHRIESGTSSNRAIAPGSATVIVGVAFYWAGNAGNIMLWADTAFGGNRQCTVVLANTGKIQVRNGSESGTLLGETASAVLVSSAWNFIEAKILVANSGSYAVKCNGVSVLTGSGDTQEHSTSTIAGFQVTPGANNGMDDLYVLDSTGSALNDFIGDCKVECLSPQPGNGANTGLTCSTGTDHGALVDELPANDDTDYNFGTTAGVKDTYTFTNVATTGVIKAVQVSARVKKTDTPAKTVALVARVGSTDYDGATQITTTNYAQVTQIWEKRPSDLADWTIADVNAAEFGLKVVA